MKRRSFLIVLCCLFLGGDASSQSNEEVFYLDRKPEQNQRWFDTPTVYVCKDARVSETRVKQAMDLWRKLGYEFRGPIMRSEIEQCIIYDSSFGKILIGSNTGRVPENNAAITRTWHNTTSGEILSAFIEIKPQWVTTELVLEHELGHALGWDHCNKKYHLMHSIHNFGGWDTSGLNNRYKISLFKNRNSEIGFKIYID